MIIINNCLFYLCFFIKKAVNGNEKKLKDEIKASIQAQKEMDADKLAAYQTLYTCLETVAKLIAPVAPFYADRLFADLTAVAAPGTSSTALYSASNFGSTLSNTIFL